MNKVEWIESDDLNIDGCSTASSLSTRAESIASIASPSNCVLNKNTNNINKSNPQDSLSDAELSDYSLNESDEEEYRPQSNSGRSKNLTNSKPLISKPIIFKFLYRFVFFINRKYSTKC